MRNESKGFTGSQGLRADPKKAKREAIARQIAEFEALGGKVQQIPEGERAIPEFAYRQALMDGETIVERNRRFKKWRRK
jgi:hypothetical protein